MPVVVNVVSQEEFASWLAQKKAALKPAAPVAAVEEPAAAVVVAKVAQ
jgi:heme/copper-type cytochrome/quinol oxidase subunit 2